MNESKTRTIQVKYLARVEGEGGVKIRTKGKSVEHVELNIFEPPRFFEALLRGRSFLEAPDITARICGICPVAYQMSACHAMENACGIQVHGALRELRRVLYCGEWIESHTMHITMLHAPDFLGYAGAVEMAKDHPEVVKRGLAVKKIGNEVLKVLGGREIHPVNVRVGGFYAIPAQEKLHALRERLRTGADLAEEMVRWTAGFRFPNSERRLELVSLQHPDEYPMTEGQIASSAGPRIDARDFEQHFEEVHVPHSTALHAIRKGAGEYLVGPMARFHHNFERLAPRAKALAKELGYVPPCMNPYKSIVIRALEVLHACEEAGRILESVCLPESPAVEVPAASAPAIRVGYGCTEAPRGLLYHRYEIDGEGLIRDAKIVPPTSQNQKAIESDLRQLVEREIDSPEATLAHECERIVRNYDPCISCATHFLKLHIDRS